MRLFYFLETIHKAIAYQFKTRLVHLSKVSCELPAGNGQYFQRRVSRCPRATDWRLQAGQPNLQPGCDAEAWQWRHVPQGMSHYLNA
jgi:hypothetical protein